MNVIPPNVTIRLTVFNIVHENNDECFKKMLCGLNNYKCLIHDQERNECCMSFERMP